MLVGTENQSLYREYYDIIEDIETKEAFSYLVGWASSLKNYSCLPSSHGVIKDFRFMRDTDWDFAFIPNQKWLLFYFRKPSLRFEKYSRARILEKFPEAKETKPREFTLRISNFEMAAKIATLIES